MPRVNIKRFYRLHISGKHIQSLGGTQRNWKAGRLFFLAQNSRITASTSIYRYVSVGMHEGKCCEWLCFHRGT